MSITIERVDQLTLQIGNHDDPSVRALLADIPKNTAPVQLVSATLASTEAPRAAASTLAPPAYGERWAGQGGFYGGTMPAMHGLPARHLVFSEDEAAALKWGGYGDDITGASSHYDGRANTAALIARGDLHPAAQWCADYRVDGHEDFHLPSRADLLMAYWCAPHRFEKTGWYWTSTQLSRFGAYVQDFEFGYSFWGSKDSDCRVRAVRWIPLTA